MEPAVYRFCAGYFHTLSRVMAEPRAFFAGLEKASMGKAAVGFLAASSLFFSVAANLVHHFPSPLVMTAVLFVNAMGMTLIGAGLGYVLMVVSVGGRRFSFLQVFSVYAYASGTVFLAAWIPLALWLTEPWKWWLVGTGLCRCCGLKWPRSLFVVGFSIGILVLTFWAMLPVLK